MAKIPRRIEVSLFYDKRCPLSMLNRGMIALA